VDTEHDGFEAGIGGHGIVATLSRGSAQGRVGLRADMDAPPITEETGLPYASRNPGIMHACGRAHGVAARRDPL
jgi:metal-dependent amidase/aminoacylase/carboxypeptidase family protein